MGLDSYAYAAKTAKPNPQDEHSIVFGFITPEDDYEYFDGIEPVELHYWRKFNALHNWMHQLYLKRGGTEEFNCRKIPLGLDDLEALKKACDSKSLTPVSGFFFGSQEPVSDAEYDELRLFIKNAAMYINDGYVVCYDSWW